MAAPELGSRFDCSVNDTDSWICFLAI